LIGSEKSFYSQVGELIRDIRTQNNIKQDALAKHLGVTRVTISNIETARQRIQLHTLIEIARYFNLPVQSLLPSPNPAKGELISRMEKKISNAGISNNAQAVKNVTNFVNKTITANTAKNVHPTSPSDKNRAEGRRTSSRLPDH
jgi:transcriptional regulator with XRE-family HTH domain